MRRTSMIFGPLVPIIGDLIMEDFLSFPEEVPEVLCVAIDTDLIREYQGWSKSNKRTSCFVALQLELKPGFSPKIAEITITNDRNGYGVARTVPLVGGLLKAMGAPKDANIFQAGVIEMAATDYETLLGGSEQSPINLTVDVKIPLLSGFFGPTATITHPLIVG